MTSEIAAEYGVILCVGDTTFLDYDGIIVKKEGYGPIGKGGNGLILHSALAIVPETGQALGMLWQKIWHREPKPKPPKDETPEQKKQRQAEARKQTRKRPVGLRSEINIPETGKRAARQAKLEVRFCQVNLRTPYRFADREPLKVYAVYALEVDQFWILDFRFWIREELSSKGRREIEENSFFFNLKSKIQNPKSKIQNPKSKIG